MFNTDVIRYSQKKCFPLLTFPRERREFVTKELSGFQNQYELWFHLLRLQPAHAARHCTQLGKDVSSLHERAGLTHTILPSSSSPWGQQLPPAGTAGMENVLLWDHLRERQVSPLGDKRHLVILNEHFSLYYCF